MLAQTAPILPHAEPCHFQLSFDDSILGPFNVVQSRKKLILFKAEVVCL